MNIILEAINKVHECNYTRSFAFKKMTELTALRLNMDTDKKEGNEMAKKLTTQIDALEIVYRLAEQEMSDNCLLNKSNKIHKE